MPGFLTDHANNLILDCLFGGRAIEPPPMLYFGLSRYPANRSGKLFEPSHGGYARVGATNDATTFSRSKAGAKFNVVAITFPAPWASWGKILSIFIADDPQGGDVLAIADLPATRFIEEGDPAPTIAVGALFLDHH